LTIDSKFELRKSPLNWRFSAKVTGADLTGLPPVPAEVLVEVGVGNDIGNALAETSTFP
jgi:hypothetical protein